MCKHPLDDLEARALRESHEIPASPLDGKVMVFFRGHYNKLLRVEEEDVQYWWKQHHTSKNWCRNSRCTATYAIAHNIYLSIPC